MRIVVSEVPAQGGIYRGTEPATILQLEAETGLRAGPTVEYDLKAEVVGQELLVRGRLGLAMEFRCSRCGEFFRRDVRGVPFDLLWPLEGEQDLVDLTAEMRETILLAFPTYPQCNAGCKGLCAQCGANLNRGQCPCRPPADLRWSALNGLGHGSGE